MTEPEPMLVVHAVVGAQDAAEVVILDADLWAVLWRESQVIQMLHGVLPIPPGAVLVVDARLESATAHADRVALARAADTTVPPTPPYKVHRHDSAPVPDDLR